MSDKDAFSYIEKRATISRENSCYSTCMRAWKWLTRVGETEFFSIRGYSQIINQPRGVKLFANYGLTLLTLVT